MASVQAGYTPKELAARWNCTHEHVLNLISMGCLRAVDIALVGAKRRRYVITPEVLEAFEAERSVGKASQDYAKPTKRRTRKPEVEQFFN